MEWEKITNHVELILKDSLSQDRDRPRINALLKSIGELCQYLEDIADTLIVERTLAQAIGKQLDQYGRIVGEPRLGALDDDYRRFIRARILANNSESKPDDLIRVLAMLMDVLAEEIKLSELYPAAYELQVVVDVAPTIEVLRRIGRVMESIRPIGMGQKVILGVDNAFILDKAGHGLELGKLGMVL
jgi:hypothetical protein